MEKCCSIEPIRVNVDFRKIETDSTAYFRVTGMECTNCANRVRNSVLRLEGVHMATVNFREGVAAVVYNPATRTTDALQAVIHMAGEGQHLYTSQLLRVIESPCILHESL